MGTILLHRDAKTGRGASAPDSAEGASDTVCAPPSLNEITTEREYTARLMRMMALNNTKEEFMLSLDALDSDDAGKQLTCLLAAIRSLAPDDTLFESPKAELGGKPSSIDDLIALGETNYGVDMDFIRSVAECAFSICNSSVLKLEISLTHLRDALY